MFAKQEIGREVGLDSALPLFEFEVNDRPVLPEGSGIQDETIQLCKILRDGIGQTQKGLFIGLGEIHRKDGWLRAPTRFNFIVYLLKLFCGFTQQDDGGTQVCQP